MTQPPSIISYAQVQEWIAATVDVVAEQIVAAEVDGGKLEGAGDYEAIAEEVTRLCAEALQHEVEPSSLGATSSEG